VADGATWGSVIMIRMAGAREFTRDEIDLLDRTSPLFARAVRRGLVTEASRAAAPAATAPGVLELDAAGRLEGASSTAEPLLEELSGTTPEAGWRSPAVQAMASATRQAIAARASQLPSSAVKTPAGTWLVLHGALLGGDGVAIFIQRAHPTLVAPLLLEAYGLTAREQEVTQLLLRGATTAQIADKQPPNGRGDMRATALAYRRAMHVPSPERRRVSTDGKHIVDSLHGRHLRVARAAAGTTT
jgi:hypothetical protein